MFAMTMALLVQELRSIPDMLERRVGLTGAQAKQAEGVINGVLMATKAKLSEALNATGRCVGFLCKLAKPITRHNAG